MGREENVYIGRTRECLRNRKICCIGSDGGRLEWVLKKGNVSLDSYQRVSIWGAWTIHKKEEDVF